MSAARRPEARRRALLLVGAVATAPTAAGPARPPRRLLRPRTGTERGDGHGDGDRDGDGDGDGAPRRRSLGPSSLCGSNWQDAYDSCDQECDLGNDAMCGPGRYCFGYVDCEPPAAAAAGPSQGSMDPLSELVAYAENGDRGDRRPNPAPAPRPKPAAPSVPGIPSYIASLPRAPSDPYATPAPFVLPVPTPNLKYNPTNNFCGYGWEHARNECFHACPSGKDDECPGGRACHSWMTCTPAAEDPATFNVCGRSWAHAASVCATRCFLGSDDDCPAGQSCFGGVTECGDDLPPLTAVDVALAEKTYTEEEIAVLLDEEIQKERDEEALSNPRNWWCGASWTNMLETCAKRCTSDDDCKPNAWTDGKCFKTTGGPDNCATPGVPAKAPLPPGSRWCGATWNRMLETCAAKCEADEDCPGGQTCWEAPGTCQYTGVPVKEPSDPATLWCGKNYGDAATSCTKACPGESDEECPEGMSCFGGSECTEEGVPVVREGYRCGTSWEDAASGDCGKECQNDSECRGAEQCFSNVVCEKDKEPEENPKNGKFCGKTWEKTGQNCRQPCKTDDDCPGNNSWCYWVECEEKDGDEEDEAMKEPSRSSEDKGSCDAEVKRCPSGVFVGKAPQLDCDFYPCPEDDGATSPSPVDEEVAELQAMSAAAAADEEDVLAGWGTTPLAHECASDGRGACGLCQGDCNSDADCKEGLFCFSRAQGEATAVPGCVGGGMDDKPGMDYCYAPFGPTTTTATTTTTTTTTTTMEWRPAWTIGYLDYARECTVEAPCGACEGDCDGNAHCQEGLLCFSRGVGSVEPVPGCIGLGIGGMDYCYDRHAPLVSAPTTSPTDQVFAGCSAEVRSCPGGGGLIRQDPGNNCEWERCPASQQQANVVPRMTPRTPLPMQAPATPLPTPDTSSFYCGYSVAQVNLNCNRAMPCPSGRDTECSGLEICLRDTYCGSPPLSAAVSALEFAAASAPESAPDTAASSVSAPTEHEGCDELCLDILPSDWCPDKTQDLNLPSCLDVDVGQLCEGDGECATDDALNNCDTYDIYARVVCGEGQKSQGELMRLSATSRPTLAPTGRPTKRPTTPPTLAPTRRPTPAPTKMPISTSVPTVNAMNMLMEMAQDAESAERNSVSGSGSTSVTIADAIAIATTNSEAGQSSQTPIKEYQSNVATAITYDRHPGGGESYDRTPGGRGENEIASAATVGHVQGEELNPVGSRSNEWHDPRGRDETSMGINAETVDSYAWESYFQGPIIRSPATITMAGPFAFITGLVMGMLLDF